MVCTPDNESGTPKRKSNGTLIALWGIVVVFVVTTILLLVRLTTEKTQVTQYTVRVECVADSVAEIHNRYIQGEFTDSVVARINRQEEELHRNYELFMKARQEDADIVKYLSILGGLIVSACAILGVRSLKEFMETVKTQVETDARTTASIEAQRIAAEEAQKIAQQTAKSEAKKKAKIVAKKQATTIATAIANTVSSKTAETKAKEVAETSAKNEIDHVVKSEVKKGLQDMIESDNYFKTLEERLRADIAQAIGQYESEVQDLKEQLRTQGAKPLPNGEDEPTDESTSEAGGMEISDIIEDVEIS